VIEDSVSGVEAGLAAGMKVFAFGSGVTKPSLLARDGVTLFMDMSDLPSLLH
jgi:beta-phosphoglucomutase-like phosphatase (HAD superfamily)